MKKMANQLEYERGKTDGFIDSMTISQPHNTGGHTISEYVRVHNKYFSCLDFELHCVLTRSRSSTANYSSGYRSRL